MSWFDIFKATCVRCKRPYRGIGLEVPKVDGEYLYNFPYKRRRELERRQDDTSYPLVPRVCRECAPKVTQEALAFEGKETHPAEWKHTMRNLNVCDKHKELWIRNHGTHIDKIRESWVKHTNDNTICDYVENPQGKTEKITQVKLRGGKVIKGYVDILKVRTKGADGKWVVREREAELDSQSGFGGGGGGKPPTRGGGKGTPGKDDDEDKPYSQPHGMALDEHESTIVPELFRDEEEVAMNPEREYCCNKIKEILLDAILEEIKEREENLTTNQETKIKKTIQEMPCETLHQMTEPENKDNFKLFGLDLTNYWSDFNAAWTLCMAEKNKDRGFKEDLTEDEEFDRRRQGKVSRGEISAQEKSQTRYRRMQNLRRTKKGRRQSKRQPHHIRGIERGEGETWGHEESEGL